MAREELAEILGRTLRDEVMLQQSLDRVRNFGCESAVADRTSDRLMESDRSTEAEIVGVQQAVSGFDFFAFDADIGNPVLAATVGAAGDVQLQVLLKAGEPFLQLFDEPARKTLGFGDRELAEFRTAAGDGASPEG